MKKIFLAGIIALMSSAALYAQVGVNTETPNPLTVLDVMKKTDPKGIMVPRMTELERDAIDVSNDSVANSLMIYNTDEDCYNYYSKAQGSWNSVCGGVPKAVFTVENCDAIVVHGSYTQGVALDASDYLTVTVNVTKAGSYTFSGNTSNGYGFTTQGTVLTTGSQSILVPGQGKPVNENQTPGDLVTFTSTGGLVNCTTLRIPVMPPTASFSINCGTAKFNGAYVKNKSLTAANTVTLSVNVTDISTGGSWSVYTNTVNGVSFKGSGMFSTLGQQTITLQGTGTPTTTDPITLTFTTNSKDGAATCNATVSIAIPPMKVLGLGQVDLAGGANYGVFNTLNANAALSAKADNAKMVYDTHNFGILDNSTVKFGDGVSTWLVDPNSGYPTAANVVSALTGPTPPDIVVIGYLYDGNASAANVVQAFATYLQKKGVLLMFCENPTFNQNVMNAVFGGGSVTSAAQDGNALGARYQFPMLNTDPVINGPFGNLGGLFWGEDASTTSDIHTISSNISSQVTVYSTVEGNVTTAGNITAFKHNSLNWIWVGDGGFNSCYDHISTTICPFLIQQTPPYIPVIKPNYSGSNTGMGAGPVYNSIFMANALAWALDRAMNNGINQH